MATQTTTPPVDGDQADDAGSGRQSRAERMRQPKALDVAQAVAEQHGVCVRPVALKQFDNQTYEFRIVPAPCGSTVASQCPSCAERKKKLRMVQLREGWHLEAEPDFTPEPPTCDQRDLLEERANLVGAYEQAKAEGVDADELDAFHDEVRELDAALRQMGVRGKLPPLEPKDKVSKKRSTRRRQDAPNLPRRQVTTRTVGEVFGGKYRPSMFLTLTLDSYGPVHSARERGGQVVKCRCGTRHTPTDSIVGTPLDPSSYDYRRAARDAVHFPKLVDRFWQNLRRCVGWEVQYFSTVEPQKRYAPHLHAAVRGAIPREVVRQVVAATYHQVWWPQHDELVYSGEQLPEWDMTKKGFTDPATGQLLPTWAEALEDLDASDQADEVDPAHVVTFGGQVDTKGLLGGTEEAGRHVGYLTKYLTKSIAEVITPSPGPAELHADRLHAELKVTPCSPRCPVWVLYGVQPQGARSSMRARECKGKAHRRTTLGIGGRRVLVSRKWSGKSMADHAEDRREFVRQSLAVIGIVKPQDPPGRYTWERVGPDESGLVPPRDHLLMHAVAQRVRWKAEYARAQLAAAERMEELSATGLAA